MDNADKARQDDTWEVRPGEPVWAPAVRMSLAGLSRSRLAARVAERYASGASNMKGFREPAESTARTATDEQLMERIHGGDVSLLALLFERYHARLFNFFARTTGDRTASEDLVQDVFFRVLKYRHSYEPAMVFATWVYQVARNARLDYYRKRKQEVPWAIEHSPPVEPRDEVEHEQEHDLLRRALMSLPAEKRELLVMVRFQGLKYEQAGEVLGCEAGAVKVRVHRALRELREIYLELQGGKRQ